MLENLAPRGDSPPLHIHHTEDEVFHVIEGEFRVRVGDQERRVRAGETLLAPKGVPHSYLVASDRGRWLVITAHTDFERFVRAFSRPATRHGLPEPSRPPSPDQAAALATAAREHGIELVGPPIH